MLNDKGIDGGLGHVFEAVSSGGGGRSRRSTLGRRGDIRRFGDQARVRADPELIPIEITGGKSIMSDDTEQEATWSKPYPPLIMSVTERGQLSCPENTEIGKVLQVD